MTGKNESLAIVVLAAGKGIRMRSTLPKVLHPVAGRTMLAHVLHTATELDAGRIVVVVGPGMQEVEKAAHAACANGIVAVQNEPRGTGNAVMAAKDALRGFDGTALVLYADTPLITPETLQHVLHAPHDLTVLGMHPHDPGQYGRLKLGADGTLEAIVEYKDASEQERAIPLCNSGVMAVRNGRIFELLAELTNDNAKGEYYLTDAVAIARRKGLTCGVAEAPETELLGANSRTELAVLEATLQHRLRMRAMESGVTLVAPETVFFSADTTLAQDVLVQPHVFFGTGVRVEEGVEIRGFSHIEGAHIGKNCIIGPFARLRPGTVLEGDNKVGNFVEMKKTTLETGAQVSHLSYLGDAQIGEGSNIGAGTITCNYDGVNKHRTTIGKNVFVGSNAALVAPVVIGNDALIGAGSVITRDVPPAGLAIGRGKQEVREGGAEKHRKKR